MIQLGQHRLAPVPAARPHRGDRRGEQPPGEVTLAGTVLVRATGTIGAH
jgi:hypothetical protein